MVLFIFYPYHYNYKQGDLHLQIQKTKGNIENEKIHAQMYGYFTHWGIVIWNNKIIFGLLYQHIRYTSLF